MMIVEELRNPSLLDPQPSDEVLFSHLIDRLGKGRPDAQDYSKQLLLPYYQQIKHDNPKQWKSWNMTPKLERRLLRVLQTKPRRTASGVATITVITKPWRCASDCLYCPNDVRMPKSYLSDEPACQRAERNFFDPYLQVQDRLRALKRMGHLTDKIEIIVLGGSWCDYPPEYQLWFTYELYRALNDGESGAARAEDLRQDYLDAGFISDKEELAKHSKPVQDRVNRGELTYNQAIRELYGINEDATKTVSPALPDTVAKATVTTAMDALCAQQALNESTQHRMVGFTVETRPDLVSAKSLTLMRKLGVTRLQIGIQSLSQQVLQLNRRATSAEQIRNAFALARSFGFKIHGHFMQNLLGSTREADAAEYLHFMTDPAYIPDEIKLYPCSLIAGTGLVAHYEDGSWQPYDEDDLVKLLAENTLNTPAFVRISRMIRDISSHDIMAGSKRTNLRQMVEASIDQAGDTIREIRHREISNHEVIHDDLHLDIVSYDTLVSTEHFLQWVTAEERIAGFLRLSLPKANRAKHLPICETQLPTAASEAMIREVHVYGKVAAINKAGESAQHKRSEGKSTGETFRAECSEEQRSFAQHFGLGSQLVEKACEIAQTAGYSKVWVISSIGTREYYRKLGFSDAELYQVRKLD